MSKNRARPVVLRDERDPHGEEHPAVVAWRRVTGAACPPERVEVLKETPRSRIYRLVGAGPGGVDVIARQRPRGLLREDEIVSFSIHPQLAIKTLHCYGFDESESAEHSTLFFEDVGGEPYVGGNAAHRALAGRWLGAFHAAVCAASLEPEVDELPDRGPDYYLTELRSAARLVETDMHIRRGAEANALADVLSVLGDVERRWPTLEHLAAGGPRTLVHGDFKPENLRVLSSLHDGPMLAVLDWEAAGWGPPAVDLARAPFGQHGLAARPDLDAYALTVSEAWPQLDRRSLDDLALAGTIFRVTVALAWEALSLEFGHGRPLRRVCLYAEMLRRLLADAGYRPTTTPNPC